MKQQNDEDIDLIDIFLTVWQNKWIILAFVLFVVISGGVYLQIEKNKLLNAETIYISEINFSVNNMWAHRNKNFFYQTNNNQTVIDFKKLFYSKEVFFNWKSSNNKYQIIFDDIIKLTTVDESKVKTKTNDNSKFSEIFDYSNYVNDILTSEYLVFYQNEYDLINKKIIEFNSTYPESPSSNFLFQLVVLEQFFTEVDKGKNLLNIYPPTNPYLDRSILKKTSNLNLKYIGLIILGATIGSFFVFVQNALRKRKKELKDS